MAQKTVASNRKANFNYFLYDRYDAGIVLKGTEIKSIRAGQMSLKEAYVRVEENEAWLVDAHIAPYKSAGIFNHDPQRPRKLLLHRKEIDQIDEKIRQRGMTVVPLRVYLDNGLAKVEIALAKGKKQYDKRQAIARRDSQREIERHLRNRN